ncbi:protein LURP-one-related 11-like [Ziziphus jujuba]|uniref:Protein LURP-one-related 11-like n=1 Tax=Ziziphus jujuba TaxID=326968 RepID=A0A6P4BED8_ZIZJJ|nr:protein LURP-one-related 11-like [Ziziphus jujuba]
MAKVHPQALLSSTCQFSSKQETFTIWMKSLVLNGNGCTVFDSKGQIVYRVDNYNSKCRDEVYLMDSKGKVLYTILRKKKFKLFTFWEGYRSSAGTATSQEKPGFQVKKTLKISRSGSPCEFIAGLDKNQPPDHYHIQRWTRKPVCNIVDNLGRSVAEVKKKQSASGEVLGDDVLKMVVEPFIDHCLIMGFFVVYSLINWKM